MIDYAQHGIRLAQLLRLVDDHCLSNDLSAAYEVACEVIAESRMLATSLRLMEQDRLAAEARRKQA